MNEKRMRNERTQREELRGKRKQTRKEETNKYMLRKRKGKKASGAIAKEYIVFFKKEHY